LIIGHWYSFLILSEAGGGWARRPNGDAPDPRLPRWGLVGCGQLDPSQHPATQLWLRAGGSLAVANSTPATQLWLPRWGLVGCGQLDPSHPATQPPSSGFRHPATQPSSGLPTQLWSPAKMLELNHALDRHVDATITFFPVALGTWRETIEVRSSIAALAKMHHCHWVRIFASIPRPQTNTRG
jgi:hypothetical protein